MFGNVRKVLVSALTGVLEKLEQRMYRNSALPEGFVLPSKRGMHSPRSVGSLSTAASAPKSVRFLVPAATVVGAKTVMGFVVVTPQDEPRKRSRKLRRIRSKSKSSAADMFSRIRDTAPVGAGGGTPPPKAFLPGLLGRGARGSGSDSDSDSDSGRRRQSRRAKFRRNRSAGNLNESKSQDSALVMPLKAASARNIRTANRRSKRRVRPTQPEGKLFTLSDKKPSRRSRKKDKSKTKGRKYRSKLPGLTL